MNSKIKKAAKKYLKSARGEISLEQAIDYAQALNYKVVFFSSPENEHIVRFALEHVAKSAKAFTYNRLARVIFISDSLPYAAKLHRLLHEIGHISLCHIGTLYLKNNDEIESEAEAFVHEVLYKKHASFPPVMIAVLIAASLAAGMFAGYSLHRESLPQSQSREAVKTLAEPGTVCVTPSGTKYHRTDCMYVKGGNSIVLSKAEAERRYAPCSVCKP